jgi:hypothetical protein
LKAARLIGPSMTQGAAIAAQAGDEGLGLPVAERRFDRQTLAA